MNLQFDYAGPGDLGYLRERDRHVLPALVAPKLEAGEFLIVRNENSQPAGWLRFGYFWDNTPFLNMMWLDEEYRRKGEGRRLLLFWEEEMRRAGHRSVLTSTQADEDAQHFYRRLGYREAGCLLLPDQALEMLFRKELGHDGVESAD